MNTSQKLNEIRKYLDALMVRSPKMHGYGTYFATLGDSDGDACLFNGLLASVGLPIGDNGVTQSQAQHGEPMAGMFYRSPIRRSYGTDLNGHKAYFSRDMALGVLNLFASRRYPPHETMAHNWLNWIDHNRACVVKKPKWLGGGCLIRGLYRFAPDDRSIITPTIWALMGRVWENRGWPKHPQMEKWKGSDGDASIIEADTCDLGYQLHLKVVQAYIKLLIGQSKEYSKRVGQIAHERIPENLFYEFVERGKITEEMIDRYLEIKPPFDQEFGNSWIWEKSEVTEARIKQSCGWDFIFMGKLITRYA